MLDIRHIALAVNKMDLVDWSQRVFDEITLAYRCCAEDLGFETITAIPLSALEGHNIVDLGHAAMPWYEGPSLLQWLETVPIERSTTVQPFAMSVQWVNRPNLNFRGFSGRIASGSATPGDSVRISPSEVTSRVKEIVIWEWSNGLQRPPGNQLLWSLRMKSTQAGVMSLRPLLIRWSPLISLRQIFSG